MRLPPEEHGSWRETQNKKILQETIIEVIKKKFLFFFITDGKELQEILLT